MTDQETAKPESEAQTDQSKKTGTRPGWKPASVLPQLKARPGFTARWVRNDSGNIQKKMVEGWVLMKPSDNVGVEILQANTPDSNALASEIRYRDSIAMMLPDELKQARTEHFRSEALDAQTQILRKSDEQFRSHGVQTYTPKGQAGRIVID